MDMDDVRDVVVSILGIGFLLGVGVMFVWGIFALHAKYSIWSQAQYGHAQLRKSEFTKKIAVQEAQAKYDAAKMLAQAEVERAKGVAEANKIIGESLKNNEAYLKYLWVDGLQHTKNQIVYIPTEASLPVLEAGKR